MTTIALGWLCWVTFLQYQWFYEVADWWEQFDNLEGEVSVSEDHGSHQSPHVETEAEPGADDLHPDCGHVGRDCSWAMKISKF